MKIPIVSAYFERQMASRLPAAIESRLAEEAPKIEQRAREKMAMELARQMFGNDGNAGGKSGYQLTAQVPFSYPQVQGSPRPLYGYDQPLFYATPNTPKRRPNTILSTDTLRQFAKNYDVLRSCINHLKTELHAQPFVIGPKDENDASAAMMKRVKEATYFFGKRGGLGEINQTRRHYESMLVEDTLVIGAFAAWKKRNLAGDLLNSILIDSATIRPRMDAYGWPGPGENWFEQWILGMKITEFLPDELTYDGLYPRTDSPYFDSPVEYLIATVLSALKADEWNRVWLTEGNTPGQMFNTPETWTPSMIREYSEYFNMLMIGDLAKRQSAIFVPTGVKESRAATRKDQDFQEFMLWLLRRTCSIMGVSPASIGFAGEQYKVSQEESMNSTTQFGASTLLDLRNEHYDDLLQDLGYHDLEVRKPKAAEETNSERDSRLVTSTGGFGFRTVNDARKLAGEDPIAGGDVILVPNGTITLDFAQQEPDIAPDASDPKSQAPADDAEDLNRWLRKSIRRVKDGRPAKCTFESATISREKAFRIATGLADAMSIADVQSVFRAATEDEGDDDAEDDRKRKRLIPLLLSVMGEVPSAFEVTVADLQNGQVGITGFAQNVVEALEPLHTQAATLGRVRATLSGDTKVASAADIELGIKSAKSQLIYLEKLAGDIQGGLSEAQIRQRVEGFARRLVGTANQAWANSLEKDDELDWVDTEDESECGDCEELASNSPYTPETIPTLPGLCQTQCRKNCRCYVVAKSGSTSFYDPADGII